MAVDYLHGRQTLDTAGGQAAGDLKTVEACVEGWVGDAALVVGLDGAAYGQPSGVVYRDGREAGADRHPLGQNLKPKLCLG